MWQVPTGSNSCAIKPVSKKTLIFHFISDHQEPQNDHVLILKVPGPMRELKNTKIIKNAKNSKKMPKMTNFQVYFGMPPGTTKSEDSWGRQGSGNGFGLPGEG